MPPVCIALIEEANLKQWEELLCNSKEEPITLANTRKIAHEILHQAVIKQINSERSPLTVSG